MSTGKSIKIGLAQLLVEGGEPERNFERAEKLIVEAKSQGCQVVLLPETIDFAWTHPSALTEAQPIPGPYSETVQTWAKTHQVYVCVGLTEKTPAGNYNTALLVNPQGEILIHYHKINLLTVEFPYYQVGQSLHVVDTEFGKIGVNICADNYLDGLPIGHTLARMGAQVILSPSSWTVDHGITEEDDPYRDKWKKPFTTLSGLYDLVIASTTSVGYIVGGPYEGKKMVGCSLVVNNKGLVAQGPFNEFAGHLEVVEFAVPQRREKGTEIGEMLKTKGYCPDG
ncbi:MAG: carbon-nitrogen hydrolase family protein [Bdellovibrionaceae bacterium]|nr:carbon-nitrogen hydrolase family protein [Bdellovibrionales bacterium]MCB9083093.1 carbon-nitrogen hydrolase family protein [Pseudobdellovibrionaceae bacterium]